MTNADTPTTEVLERPATGDNIARYLGEHEAMAPRVMQIHDDEAGAGNNIARYLGEHEAMAPRVMQIHDDGGAQ